MPRTIQRDNNDYTVAEPTDSFDTPESVEPAVENESGWGAFNKIKSAGFLDRFSPSNQLKLIKILDAQPVKAYRQHWINDSPVAKKSFVCEGRGNCPLCDKVADKPQVRVLFNVVDLSGAAPEVKTWTIGTMLAETLSNFAQSKPTSPIDKPDLYWAVSSTGGGKSGRISYNLIPVKTDSLNDYEVEPLTDTQLSNFHEVKATAESVRHSSQEELNQVADHLLTKRNN